jgi:hypothetical protein
MTQPTEADAYAASGQIAAAINRGELDKRDARIALRTAGYSEEEAHDIANVYFEAIDRTAALKLVDEGRVKVTADCFFVVDGTIHKGDHLAVILESADLSGLLDAPRADWPDGMSPVTLTTAGKAALAVEVLP